LKRVFEIRNYDFIRNSKFFIRNYQEDLVTPGISPLFANSLKHILHSPNALINPLLLPHLKQRLINLEEYFGFFFALAICDVLAINLESRI